MNKLLESVHIEGVPNWGTKDTQDVYSLLNTQNKLLEEFAIDILSKYVEDNNKFCYYCSKEINENTIKKPYYGHVPNCLIIKSKDILNNG